jgi:RNAse (barnase) inhibitor barstar
MAAFQGDDFNGVDWGILQVGACALFNRPAILKDAVGSLIELGYTVQEFDCSYWAGSSDFHDAMAGRLGFPSYYGRNLAAFRDCLSDVPIEESRGGLAFVFLRYDMLAAQEPEFAQDVLGVIEDCSRFHILCGRRLLALLQTDDPLLAFDPVAPRPVIFNLREHSYELRGLSGRN